MILRGTGNVNEEDCYPLIAAVKAFDSFTFLDRIGGPVTPNRLAEFLIGIFEQKDKGWIATLNVGLDDETSRRLSHHIYSITKRKLTQELTTGPSDNDEDY